MPFGGSAGLAEDPLGRSGWAARKASGVRTPSFCAQLCASVTLARHLDLSVLPASFPHLANGASLSHLSQYPRLRKEQARGGVVVGGGRPQEVSVERQAPPASTLGEDSTEGTTEQLGWAPRP